MSFLLIPAIDVRDSRVVRLAQGDYARETVYDVSPLDAACRLSGTGAQWLHLVDLDAARLGGYSLQSLVGQIVHNTALQVQTGGGIRTEQHIEQLLESGVARIVVGTLAVREPERIARWLLQYGAERITVALDARQDAAGEWRLPVSGWTEDSAHTLGQMVQFYVDAGLRHLLCTDIARDGMLAGFNVSLYAMLAQRWPQLEVQASGGVRGVADIVAVRSAGARAAILGRGLLEGQFTLAEALSC